MAQRILLVEDDPYLRQGLDELLTREGYDVTVTPDCQSARDAFASVVPELVILDMMLPDGDGLTLCEEFRRSDGVPIMFLTAKDDEAEIVRGLDAGADDYLTKPFRGGELLSRVRALLRRYRPQSFRLGDLEIDLSRMLVTKAGEPQFLTPTEFQLLRALLNHSGRSMTREALLRSIWDDGGNYIDDNTLSVHISRLREKVGAEHIKTLRGIGYRWEDEG